MKKAVFFLFLMMSTTLVMADDVTPSEAQQMAVDFLQKHKGIDARRAPELASCLTLTGQVSGLYVFNIANNGGYVIVSNDDCALPILGYADKGNLDLNNIPDNMRAWLQGYADQIAWAKENSVPRSAKRSAKRAEGENIEPFVQTKWNQGDPYNRLCPDFFTYGKCVTGCVATAMAQAMYYTASKSDWKPEATLENIPDYDCLTRWNNLGQIHVTGVAEGTAFDWDNMLTEYELVYDHQMGGMVATCTEQQATAVATLMMACGASVNMDYANSNAGGSNASLSNVPSALKSYFGYHEKTTWLKRSDFNDVNWHTLVYHELSNGRPVLYGGQSTGGGHAFVLDGYKFEDDEDYYHVNWGWGGKSDDYFTLSALDPEEQGFGGSSDKSGFNFDHDAVFGIDLSSADVELADVTSKVIDININSVTITPERPVVNEKVTFTVNVTNGSDEVFNNSLGLINQATNKWLDFRAFEIPANETVDCVFEFIPEEAGEMIIWIMKPAGGSQFTSNWNEIVTIYSEADGIQDVKIDAKVEGQYYDLQGRRIDHPVKGVYLLNGKKVVIK